MYYLFTTLGNGKQLAMVTRATEKGMSDYANRMFDKYGWEITVDVYKDKGSDIVKYTTYHA
jgi:hypothetical protein